MKIRENMRFSAAIVPAIAMSLTLVFVAGCQSKTGTGALVGGAAGAGIGGLATHSATGAVVGGAVGAGVGALAGHEMEQHDRSRENVDQPPPPPPENGDTAIVNVTNSNGSVTPVRLTRQGSGWVGPKGEYYSSLPTPEQLRPLYGF